MRRTISILFLLVLSGFIEACDGSRAPDTEVKIGHLGDYAEVGVYEEFKPQGFYIVHLSEDHLVAFDVHSTHLDCITNWLPPENKFENPCQSRVRYNMSGINIAGPDPRPLERYKISVDGEQFVVNKSVAFRYELNEWSSPDSFIDLARISF